MKRHLHLLATLLFVLVGAHARADVRCAALLGDERAAALAEAERLGLSVKVFTKRVGNQVKVLALVGEPEGGSTLNSDAGSLLRAHFDRVGLVPPRPVAREGLGAKVRSGWLRTKLWMKRTRGHTLDAELTEIDARHLPLFAAAAAREAEPARLDADLFDLAEGRPVGWLERALARFTPLHAGVAALGAASLAILPRLRWPALAGLSLIVSYESFGHLLAHVDPLANLPFVSALFPTLAPRSRAHLDTLLVNVDRALEAGDVQGVAAIVYAGDFERVSRSLGADGFAAVSAAADVASTPVDLDDTSFPPELKVTDKLLELARENPQHRATLANLSKILSTVNDENLEALGMELTERPHADERANVREAVERVYGTELDADTVTLLAGMLPVPASDKIAPSDFRARLRRIGAFLDDKAYRAATHALVSRVMEQPGLVARFDRVLVHLRSEGRAVDRLASLRDALARRTSALSDRQLADLLNVAELVKRSKHLGPKFLWALSRDLMGARPLTLKDYRDGLRSRAGVKFMGEARADHVAVALRVISNEGAVPPNHRAFRANVLAAANVELMPLKAEVNRRQPVEAPAPIPASAKPAMIDPKDFLNPQRQRSIHKRAPRVRPAAPAPSFAPESTPYVIPAHLDLEKVGADRLEPFETYEFRYRNKPAAPLQKARFGPEALAWMRENATVGSKIVDGIMIGQGDRGSHGLKALRVWRSRFYDGTIYEIKIAGGWRPLVVPVDGVWEVIKVVHKDRLKMNCEHLKPLDQIVRPDREF